MGNICVSAKKTNKNTRDQNYSDFENQLNNKKLPDKKITDIKVSDKELPPFQSNNLKKFTSEKKNDDRVENNDSPFKADETKVKISQINEIEFGRETQSINYNDMFQENNLIRVSFENGLPKLSKILSKKQLRRNSSYRKSQYIICDEDIEANDTIYFKEKELYDNRSYFFEKRVVIDYFRQYNQSKQFKDIKVTKAIRGIIESFVNSLEKLYEIEIILSQHNREIDCNDYAISCFALEENEIELFTPVFLYEIMVYPISLIKKTNLKKIYLCNSFISTESKHNLNPNTISNIVNKEVSLVVSTNEKSIQGFIENFHCEIFNLISKQFFFNDTEFNWGLINEPDFTYNNKKNLGLNYPIPGFVNLKSTISIEDDKSQVFTFMMSQTEKVFELSDKILQNKIIYIVKLLEEYDPQGIGGDNYFIVLRELRLQLSEL